VRGELYYPFGMQMPGMTYSSNEYRYGFNGANSRAGKINREIKKVVESLKPKKKIDEKSFI
jgi:hypothetical protein